MGSEIPVFNISSPSAALADSIVAAAGKHGFLFIKASGLQFSAENVHGTFDLAKTFFASPQAEKDSCSMQPNNRGYTGMGAEVLDPGTQKAGDPKEAFNFGEFVDGKAQQPLPPVFQSHEPELSRFSTACYDLCLQLLRLIAVGLKIEGGGGGGGGGPDSPDDSWFSDRHDPRKGDSGTILRLLHYPASHGGAAIRAGAHSDYGSLTLLFRLPGQPGLEILTPAEEWASVPVQPPGTESDPFPPILVNIGDLLSFWTSRLLKSTVHRVVGGAPVGGREGEDRYSIAFFCHPCRDTALIPVPSEMVRERAGRGKLDGRDADGSGAATGKVLTAAEHLQARLAATYGWEKDGIVA